MTLQGRHQTTGHRVGVCRLLFLLSIAAGSGQAGEISKNLAARLARSAESDRFAIIISFERDTDPSALRRAVPAVGAMIRSLRDSVETRFARMRARAGGMGDIRDPRLFWINQTVAMTATRRTIARLAEDPAIAMIDEDAASVSFESPGNSGVAENGALTVPWNLVITGVDSVWDAYGLDGSGVLIGSLDTGIDTTHPALSGKLRPANAWKDFIFDQPVPYDNFGHGTFGSGILVGSEGRDGPEPGIGIAYGSKLVVGKMLDAGATSISQVNEAMQWMLDPDGIPETDDFPRVINNSWFSGTRGSTYAYASAAAWRAAGIIPVFCAGNSGPAAGSTRSPGDYKNCISVGGTDAGDDRYNNTSVGPSPTDTEYFPADGRKPDFSAPGEAVTSSQKGGGYGNSSGTSWSAPHVAGIIALMLQANPSLGYDDVHSILQRTSFDAGDPGYDYVFGYGRISAMGAVREAVRARLNVQAEAVLNTSEGGGSATFSVGLKVWPRDTVWVSIASSDTTEGSVSPTLLAFTFSDWETLRQITVTGKNDFDHDGDVPYSITIRTASADPLYDGIEGTTLNALNADDETVRGVGITLRKGWNLVSLPTVLLNSDRNAVFPTSVSPAYTYLSGYVAEISMRRGAGYWLKFDADGFLDLAGDTTLAETLAVVPGWNLVGSITVPVTPGEIVSIPPGLVTSEFFEYLSGYHTADTIRPGSGYWVKVAGEGVLILRPGPGEAGTGPIRNIPDEPPSRAPERRDQ